MFKDQIEDLDSSLIMVWFNKEYVTNSKILMMFFLKLMQENEENLKTIRELQKNSQIVKAKYEKSIEINYHLKERISQLENELSSSRKEFERSIDAKTSRMNTTEENIRNLQLEITKVNSKLDQAYLEINESKSNLSAQIKIANQKTAQYNELRSSFEKLFIENQNMQNINSELKEELNIQVKIFMDKVINLNSYIFIDNEVVTIKLTSSF